MWVVVEPLLRARDADKVEELDGALARLALVHLEMKLERFGDLPADGEDRIQAGHGVLEDHRDVVAADAPDLVVVHLQDVLTVEDDRALDDAAGGLRNETHQRERGDRFPASGL